MFKIRYYLAETTYQKEVNEKILHLLQEIKNKHEIEFEISNISINKEGYVDERHVKEIYEKYFKPRAKVLKRRIGESLPRSLRSQRGRGYYYLSGVIAILEDEQIGWYTCWESSEKFKIFDEDYKVGFLKALLSQGPSLLKEICPDIRTLKSPHDFLIDEFIKTNPLQGRLEREVKIGSMIFTNKQGNTFDWRKAIDLVCYTDSITWIIEVKPKLDWEAFGQVIAYTHIFNKEQPNAHIQKGIVCEEVDPEINAICDEFDIKILIWEEGEFKFVKS
jgi:hypothetical protein